MIVFIVMGWLLVVCLLIVEEERYRKKIDAIIDAMNKRFEGEE